MTSLPSFVVVGAMRSGTTSLARYVGAHPDVHVAPHKEVHFFDKNFDRGLAWYETQFSPSGEHAIGDVTPHYMFNPQAVERMVSVLPDAKLIAILRNPIDRAYSHYWQNRSQGREQRTFEEIVRAQGPPPKHASRAYVEMGRYLTQLQRLCTHYRREQLKVLLFDDLSTNAVAVVSDTLAFLGVDPDVPVPSMVGEPLNRYQDFRSLRVRRLARRLPKRAADALGRFNRVDASYPPLDEALRQELVDLYAADNAALGAWMGRDLTAWSA